MDKTNIVKICDALSGESRANLLDYIYRNNRGISIDELSKVFKLHPNVIRAHLDKLQEIGLIESYKEIVGRGRPRKLYKKSKKGFLIQYPKRQYELLSSLLIEIIKNSNVDKEIIVKVGEEFGRKLMRKYLLDRSESEASLNTLWEAVSEIFGDWGLMPELIKIKNDLIEWDAKNCIYYELAMKHADITCHLHRSIIQGMVKELKLNYSVKIPKKFPGGYEGCYVMVEK